MRLLRFPTLSSFRKLFRASPLLSGFNAGFVNLSISPVCHSFIMHRPLGGISPQTGFLLHSGNLVLLRTPAVRRAAGRRPVKPIWRGKVQLSVFDLFYLSSSCLFVSYLSVNCYATMEENRSGAGRGESFFFNVLRCFTRGHTTSDFAFSLFYFFFYKRKNNNLPPDPLQTRGLTPDEDSEGGRSTQLGSAGKWRKRPQGAPYWPGERSGGVQKDLKRDEVTARGRLVRQAIGLICALDEVMLRSATPGTNVSLWEILVSVLLVIAG